MVVQKALLELSDPVKRTRIIAQKANPEDASLVKSDLGNIGEVVNVSAGDIESSVTIIIGDDLANKLSALQEGASSLDETPQSANHADVGGETTNPVTH